MDGIRIAAHRGYSRYYPENTLAAFRASMDIGVTMVETDVRMTADKKLVLMHDSEVDRTTDGTGTVSGMTAAQIKGLDAGIKKDARFEGERVPFLDEFLELFSDRKDIELNIELKDYPEQNAAAFESCDRIVQTLIEHKLEDRVYINSFSGAILKYVDDTYNSRFRLHGFYPFFLHGEGVTEDDLYDRLFCVCLFNSYLDASGKEAKYANPVCDKAVFDRFIGRGVEPWVYYGEDRAEHLLPAIQRGAVGITSNDPVLAMQILNGKA